MADSKMLSTENPASFANRASLASAPVINSFSVGRSAVQSASPNGSLGQMAAQASAAGSVPQFTLTPPVGSPLLSSFSTGVNPSLGVPTPFTQAQGTTTFSQPILASGGFSSQSSVPSFNSPAASLNQGLPSVAVATLLSTPLTQPLSGPGSPRASFIASPAVLTAQMMEPTPQQQQIEMIADQYLAEQGTEDQLLKFFERYRNHQRASTKCALDGRYFYKVLAPYRGLVPSEMYIRINIRGLVSTPENEQGQEFWMGAPVFDLAELAATQTEDKSPRYRLIKLIIDISDDEASNLGSVHSNLIYIDTWNNAICRFEPMTPSEYTEPINTVLEAYFAQPHLLPTYSYQMLDEHPQLPTTASCPSKGMCAAYVLKKAMMLVTDNDRPLDRDPDKEELKIMIFADAIETEYGILPEEDNDREQAGFSITLGGPGPFVSPYYYGNDWVYGPEYYGFRPHRRFARPWGWGWTHGGGHHRRHHRHHYGVNQANGVSGSENGAWEEMGRALDLGWARAKEKAYELKERIKMGLHRDANELEGRREAHRQRVELARAQAAQSGSFFPDQNASAEMQRELTASRLLSRAETGPNGQFHDPEHLRQMARLQREQFNQGKAGWQPIASTGTYAGDKFAAGIVRSKQQYGGPEYGCGCDGCHMAPPAGEFGYWNRDQQGNRQWHSVNFGGKTRREQGGWSDSMAMRTQGEQTFGSEEGCGCGVKRREMGAEHGRWSRTEYEQMRSENGMSDSTIGGGLLGAGAGFLVGGPVGAVVGGLAGGGAGHYLGRDRHEHGNGHRGDVLRPSTWQRSTQTAVVGGLLGGGAGYLLGGGTGALIGAGAGGLGGYALGGGFGRRSENGSTLTGGLIGAGSGFLLGGPVGAVVGAGIGAGTGYYAGRERRHGGGTIAGGAIGAGTGALVGGPVGAVAGGAIGAAAGHSAERNPRYEGAHNSALTGGLLGAGAGYLLGGGLSGVILGGAAGAGAGYLLGRGGHYQHYPYHHYGGYGGGWGGGYGGGYGGGWGGGYGGGHGGGHHHRHGGHGGGHHRGGHSGRRRH